MKKTNVLKIVGLVLFASFMGCKDEVMETVVEQGKQSAVKRIQFKGLEVNHRFASSVEDLRDKSYDDLLEFYKKERVMYLKSKGISSKQQISDPTLEAIVKIVDENLTKFPYATENTSEEGKWRMIKEDFPTLGDKEIQDNIDVIEEYYYKNLDYLVFSELAKSNNNELLHRRGGYYGNLRCIRRRGAFNRGDGVSMALALNAFYHASKEAERFSKAAYPRMASGNTKRDAYRHIIWSALLCKYYRTISSKAPKLRFSKAIGDANEVCGGNRPDAKQMDYHNNAIGRSLYNRHTHYRKFLWMKVGLRSPSISKLKYETKKLVDRAVLVKGTSEAQRAYKIRTRQFNCTYSYVKRMKYICGGPEKREANTVSSRIEMRRDLPLPDGEKCWRTYYIRVKKCDGNKVVYLK